jgi:hypothetical protein
MTYKEESYVLNTLKELKELVRSSVFEQLVLETHENNIMLRQIIKYLNHEIAYANQENANDFNMNVIANLISSGLDINKLIKR